ncbi:MAG TPA: trypsin-like peptidase domain-containing protein [Stellaceae bacterium]|nr:trypsin-like peptidase domain-containing protein [Stellaceae bacterium]
MTIKLVRLAVIWLLLLATAWVLEPYAVTLWASASSPRAVTPRADLTAGEKATIRLFQAVSPSVVHVFAEERSRGLFQLGSEAVVQSGSGIVWDAAGHVVTNYHVISGTSAIGARLATGEFVAARVVGVAPDYDIAVLQLERVRSALHPIAIGRSADLKVGQAAFAIGNPYGLDQTLTTGVISALHRHLPISAAYETVGAIQTDAAINPGNSGGPLLDSAGRLIGVNSAILSKSGASAGIGFAIPVDIVNKIATELIKQGHVPIPGIGIVAAPEAAAGSLGIDGIIILRTLPNSPAAQAGLVGAAAENGTVADVITAANGQPVHSMSGLASMFEKIGVGGTVKLAVTRNGRSREITVTLADISGMKRK